MDIKQRFWTENDSRFNGRKNNQSGIMVHSTGCAFVPAKAWYDRWNKSGLGKSVHAFCDHQEVWQYMEWEKRAAHCGGTGNDTHISFEICEGNPDFEKAYQNAVDLCVYLCKEFGLTEKDIISHAEGNKKKIASNHGDADAYLKKNGKSMDDLRADVKCKIAESQTRSNYETLNDVPEWYRPSIEKLMRKGLLVGHNDKDTTRLDDNILDISEDFCRMITIIDKLGLIDKGARQ